MSTQEYIKKVVEDVCEDEDFKPGSWVSVIEYVNANGGIVSGCLGDIKNFIKIRKLDQVTAIVKSCTLNVLADLTVTLKDLSSTIAGSIHHRVFHKDTASGSGSGVGGSGMLDEEEIIKSLEEEEMVELDLQVCGNVTDQKD
ncbi:ribonuclease H-like domain-containing protein [Tanacetum coccineum]